MIGYKKENRQIGGFFNLIKVFLFMQS